MIPRTIHWIWLSDEPIGEAAKRCIASWRRCAPDFAIRRWKMSDFDWAQMPRWVHEAIAAKKWAFACDYLRLWVLSHEGGWYLDSDVLMLKSPAALEKHGFVSAIEYYPGMDYPPAIQAAVMGCEAGHPFVAEVLGWYENAPFVLPDGSYNTARLAPHILADMARSRGFVWKDVRQELPDDMLVLPSCVFAPGAAESTSDSALIHLCTGSWRGHTERGRKAIDRRNMWTIIERTTAVGRLVGKLRNLGRRLAPHRVRVLCLDRRHVKGTGGDVITERNRRWLRAWCGDGRFATLALCWPAFGPLGLRNTFVSKAWALSYRVIGTLEWHLAFAWWRPEIVFVGDSAVQVPSFAFMKKCRTIVFYHNVERDYYDRSAPRQRPVVEEVERRFTQGAAARICLAERDSRRLKELYGKGADFLMPTTLGDRGAFAEKGKDGGYLLFVGSDFFGNTDGLFWFIENCLGKTGARLVVVGSGMERYRGKYADLESRGLLEFRGYVEDLGETYRRAKAVVLPITSGCGMKTKTAEALMHDKLVYGTDEAFVGYEGIDEVAVRCNSAEDFVRALRDPGGEAKKSARAYFLAHCEDGVGKRRFSTWLMQWTEEGGSR